MGQLKAEWVQTGQPSGNTDAHDVTPHWNSQHKWLTNYGALFARSLFVLMQAGGRCMGQHLSVSSISEGTDGIRSQ